MSSPFISVSFVILRLGPVVLVVSYCLFVVLSRRLYPSLISLYVCFMLVNLSFLPFVTNLVICLGTALFRVCACAASSQVTWPETVRSPGVRPVPVPVLLCLLRLRLFPFLSLCRPLCRLRRHLYPLPLSNIRFCNPFCHPLLSRPLLCLLQSCAICPVSVTCYSC